MLKVEQPEAARTRHFALTQGKSCWVFYGWLYTASKAFSGFYHGSKCIGEALFRFFDSFHLGLGVCSLTGQGLRQALFRGAEPVVSLAPHGVEMWCIGLMFNLTFG